MRPKASAIAAVALLTVGLSACSTSTTPTTAMSSTTSTTSSSAPAPAATGLDTAMIKKGDGTKTVYLVSKGFQHRFWQAVKQGAEQAGTEFGYKVEFVGPDAETQVTQQNNQLQTALDSKPAAIGFAALDTKASSSILDKIKAANIPLVAFDSGVAGDYPLTTVATDNSAAAAEAAKKLAGLVGNKGTVGLICHDQTSMTGQQRCDGFQQWMKANAPDIKVLPPQVAGEVGLAAGTAKSMVQANPDMVGLYGTNEAAATGAVQAITELNNKTVKVVGFDSGVDSDIPATTAATDNIAAAGMAADKMACLLYTSPSPRD